MKFLMTPAAGFPVVMVLKNLMKRQHWSWETDPYRWSEKPARKTSLQIAVPAVCSWEGSVALPLSIRQKYSAHHWGLPIKKSCALTDMNNKEQYVEGFWKNWWVYIPLMMTVWNTVEINFFGENNHFLAYRMTYINCRARFLNKYLQMILHTDFNFLELLKRYSDIFDFTGI